MVIIIDQIYAPEETSISFIQRVMPRTMYYYSQYLPYVYALRFSHFSEEAVPATLIYPQSNPLEKTDRKFSGTKENIDEFVEILRKVEKVANEFSINIALDLFCLRVGERLVGVKILARPELEGKLWEILRAYERTQITKEQLAHQIADLLDSSG